MPNYRKAGSPCPDCQTPLTKHPAANVDPWWLYCEACRKRHNCKVRIDYTGLKVNRLLFLRFDHWELRSQYWECICDCGTVKVFSAQAITTGHTKSCGCLKREVGRSIMERICREGRNVRVQANIEQRWCALKDHKFRSFWLDQYFRQLK